jgi:hypothetical protein
VREDDVLRVALAHDLLEGVGVGVGRVVGELGVLGRDDARQLEARGLVRERRIRAEDDGPHLLPRGRAQLLRRRHGLVGDFVDRALTVLEKD